MFALQNVKVSPAKTCRKKSYTSLNSLLITADCCILFVACFICETQMWSTNVVNKSGQQMWSTNVVNKCGQQMWSTTTQICF